MPAIEWNPARGAREAGIDAEALREAMARAIEEIPPSMLRPEIAGCEAPGVVTIRVVDDREIAALNARHLGRIGPTDVLAFPMFDRDPKSGRLHWGDIVVSRQTARRVAADLDLPVSEEMFRYIIHGFLHLAGYDDVRASDRRRMICVQERILREAVRGGRR
ncbi:MAG: rRNA maturation RNase YbeY [Planctomycetota bacterium]|nr:rRNA maturation RNase YbeY [Planctomycetota bacterium]